MRQELPPRRPIEGGTQTGSTLEAGKADAAEVTCTMKPISADRSVSPGTACKPHAARLAGEPVEREMRNGTGTATI